MAKPIEKATNAWVEHKLASEIGELLLKNNVVHDIYIFGSVAREGLGRDLDIIATTSNEIADRFLTRVMRRWIIGGYGVDDVPAQLPRIRWLEAQHILGIDSNDLLTARTGNPEPKLRWLDIIILPDNWLLRGEELHEKLPYDDPSFMANISADALRLDPQSRSFVPPLRI